MSSFQGLPERVARLEEQNDACEYERISHGAKLADLTATYHQVRGGIRMLVILWAIATGAVGLASVKYFTGPAQAAVTR